MNGREIQKFHKIHQLKNKALLQQSYYIIAHILLLNKLKNRVGGFISFSAYENVCRAKEHY